MKKEEYKNINIFLNKKKLGEDLFAFEQSRQTEQNLNLEEDYFNSSLALDSKETSGFEKNLEQQLKKKKKEFEQETVLILNLGARSSLVQNVAYQVRKLKVYSEICNLSSLCFDRPLELEKFERKLENLNLKGIILCAESRKKDLSREEKQKSLYETVFKLKIPVLGVGATITEITTFFGGKVSSAYLDSSLLEAESSKAKLFVDPDSLLFSGIESEINSSMLNSEQITALPQGFKVIAHTSKLPIAAISHQEKQIYALQIDPKALSSNSRANEILVNFLHQICDCGVTWNYSKIKDLCIQEIQAQVAKGKVFFEFKNNLESLALCIVMNEAIGQRFSCVLVDHGLSNSNQNKKLVQFLRNSFRVRAYYIDAREFFFKELQNILENKQKKEIIQQLSKQILEKKFSEIGNFDFLADYSTYESLLSENLNFLNKKKIVLSKTQITQLCLEEGTQASFSLIKPFERLFASELKEIIKNTVTENILAYLEGSLPDEGFASCIKGEITPEKTDLISRAHNLLKEELEEQSEKFFRDPAEISLSLEDQSQEKNNKSYFLTIKVKKEKALANFISLEFFDKIAFRFVSELPSITKIFYDLTPAS